MPLLQTYFGDRDASLYDALTDDTGGSVALRSFVSLAGGFDISGLGGFLNRAREGGAGEIQRPAWDGPVFQNPGPGGDTVLGNIGTSATLAIGGSQAGFINAPGDEDYYRVNLVAGQSYVFTLNATGGGNTLDCYLKLFDSGGSPLSIADDTGPGTNTVLRYTAVTSGVYYIDARAYDSSAENVGAYTLSVAVGAAQNPLDTIDFHYTVPTTTIEVYFATTGQTFGSEGDVALRNWTPAEIAAVMNALSTYSAVAPLTFTQTLNQASAEFTVMLTDLDPGVLGYFIPTQGVGAFSPSTTSWTTGALQPGSSGFVTLIHEFGHGLGMAHPHDEGGIWPDNISEIMQGVLSEFNSYGTFLMNQGVFTTMSYNDGWDAPPWGGHNNSLTTGSQGTPMALDIALIQQRYGTVAHNTGADTYTLTGVNGMWACIWDTGGIDTISYGGAGNAVIDLRAATLLNELGGAGFISYVPNAYQGFTIAHNVVIENAIGGSGADTINGNSANNAITGNGGADAINGFSGIDTSNYDIASTGATWTRTVAGGWSVTAGANGTDALTSVEFLHFTDRDVFLDDAMRSFSGNGTSDVLFRRNDGIMASWEVTGTTINTANFLPTAGAEWSVLGTGDIGGDGRDDVLWQRNDGLVYAWTMSGAGFAGAVALTGIGAEWSFLGMGDFNGDLTDDFAWQRNDGLVYVWTMQNSAIQSASPVVGLGAEWELQGLGDFNGDGKDDFLWRNGAGQTVIWHMNGSSIQSSGFTSTQSGTDWSVVGVGDTNGDGRDDILFQRASDGLVAVWAMNGTTVSSSTNIAAADPGQWSIHNVGDYNGDGREDILWQHTNGLVYVWLLNGASITGSGGLSGVGAEWTII